MATQAGGIPNKIEELGPYLGNVVPYLAANQGRLSISNANLTQLQGFWGLGSPPPAGTWNDLFPKHEDKMLRSHPINTALKTLKEEIGGSLRAIYADIPKSAWNDNDRAITGRKTGGLKNKPTPSPKPDHAPTLSIDKQGHEFHQLRMLDPANPLTRKKARKEYKHEVRRALIALPSGVPVPAPRSGSGIPDESQFVPIAITGKFLFHVSYTDADVQSTAWYKVRYVNPRGETSEWSAVVSAVVS